MFFFKKDQEFGFPHSQHSQSYPQKGLHPVTYSMDPPDHWLVVQSFIDEESAEQPANDPERSLLDIAVRS